MQFSRKAQWRIFIIVNAILLTGVLLFPLYYEYAPKMPGSTCLMLTLMHIYCPSCGGTRALRALLHFDILGSIQYNPVVVMGVAWFVAYEIAMIVGLAKKGERELFLKPWMVYVLLGVWFTYAIVRNLLLIWGIDLLGNVIPPV